MTTGAAQQQRAQQPANYRLVGLDDFLLGAVVEEAKIVHSGCRTSGKNAKSEVDLTGVHALVQGADGNLVRKDLSEIEVDDELQLPEDLDERSLKERVTEILKENPMLMPLVASFLLNVTRTLAASALPMSMASTVPIAALPLVVSGFDMSTGFAETQNEIVNELATHVGLLSLSSAVMFIGSLRGLGTMKTAVQGNYLGMLATSVGLLSVLASPGFGGTVNVLRFLCAFAPAAVVGYKIADEVDMNQMPQLIAAFHSTVGLAAVLVGFANHFGTHAAALSALKLIETHVGISMGALTFTGSVIAAAKLHEIMDSKPVISDYRWTLNGLGIAASVGLGVVYCHPGAVPEVARVAAMVANTIIWGALGCNVVLPVGGADMPIVISVLNSFSGLSTSAAGFMLGNDLLTISGALIASSGALLSDIMARGMNRSIGSVLLGGFGGGAAAPAGSPGGSSKGGENLLDFTEVSHERFSEQLISSKKILIIPGYGMAVARCQNRLAEVVSTLRKLGKTVHFAIHPVAGRLPGHMNVLLAEANVPYSIVLDMDTVNANITSYDIAIVIGANDVVNPATVSDKSSPIYGMPAIEAWKCKACVVMKRSMKPGYSGCENPLFYLQNVKMLFGDAKFTVDKVGEFVAEKGEMMQQNPNWEPESEEEVDEFLNDMPDVADIRGCNKVLGVITESSALEKRVALTPGTLAKFVKLGYKVVVQSGAGDEAGFPDSAYTQVFRDFAEKSLKEKASGSATAAEFEGLVRIAPNKRAVFEKADIVLKVSEPTQEEISLLRQGQVFTGIWSMYKKEAIVESLRTKQSTVFNMTLIPRISRAQSLDVLSSMANIAGYRAVIDAFAQYPKFSRPNTSATGSTAPAKVFIIGAGVAGLSAISTAKALGAEVFACDVRPSVEDQVTSLGATFVKPKTFAEGETLLVRPGAGGYAKEMDDSAKKQQDLLYAKYAKDCDVIVTTALIPNRPAPICITREMVNSMRRGSVIVDMGILNGGNVEGSVPDEYVTTDSGVTIIAKTNYPSDMATQASEFLARNFHAFLEVLGDFKGDGGDVNMEDVILRDSMVQYKGDIMYPPPPRPKEVTIAQDGDSNAGASGAMAAALGAGTAAALAQALENPNLTMEERQTLLDRQREMENPHNLPQMIVDVIDWLNDHKEELAMGLGLGLATDIPQEEITHLGYFVLSLLIGNFTVANVTHQLHTPLISVTNAISGIIIIGGMLQLGGPLLSAKVTCALLAVFLSGMNIVGGFAVTTKMLNMFSKSGDGADGGNEVPDAHGH